VGRFADLRGGLRDVRQHGRDPADSAAAVAAGTATTAYDAAGRPGPVDARVHAFVPAGYIGSEALKIDLHRRLALTESEDELRELRVDVEDRYGELPDPVENLFAIQESKLKLARAGADYLVFRGGRITIGPLILGSGELRELRQRAATAVYTSGKHEVALRQDDFREALGLVDAILEARQAA